MNLHRTLALFTIVGILSITLGEAEIKISRGNPLKHFCGRTLAHVLAYVCSGPDKYDADENNSFLLPDYYEAQQQQRINDIEWPWMSPHKDRSMSAPSRGKLGVLDECSKKAF